MFGGAAVFDCNNAAIRRNSSDFAAIRLTSGKYHCIIVYNDTKDMFVYMDKLVSQKEGE